MSTNVATWQRNARRVFGQSDVAGPLATLIVLFVLFSIFVPNFFAFRTVSGIINAHIRPESLATIRTSRKVYVVTWPFTIPHIRPHYVRVPKPISGNRRAIRRNTETVNTHGRLKGSSTIH